MYRTAVLCALGMGLAWPMPTSAQDDIVIVIEEPIEEILVTDDAGAGEVSYSMALDEWLWMNGIGVWERLPNLPSFPPWPPVFGPTDDPPEDPKEPDCDLVWEDIQGREELLNELEEDLERIVEDGVWIIPSPGGSQGKEPVRRRKVTLTGIEAIRENYEIEIRQVQGALDKQRGDYESAGCPVGGPTGG